MPAQNSPAPPDQPSRHLLLIEDNPADATLARMVHDQTQHCSWLEVVHDGDAALQHLTGRDGTSKPDVVLLDMTLPMKSGLELIREIRAIPGCELMPIVMVSGSDNPVALRDAYALGANCVISKPSHWEEYFDKVSACYKFWCDVVELPRPDQRGNGSRPPA